MPFAARRTDVMDRDACMEVGSRLAIGIGIKR